MSWKLEEAGDDAVTLRRGDGLVLSARAVAARRTRADRQWTEWTFVVTDEETGAALTEHNWEIVDEEHLWEVLDGFTYRFRPEAEGSKPAGTTEPADETASAGEYASADEDPETDVDSTSSDAAEPDAADEGAAVSKTDPGSDSGLIDGTASADAVDGPVDESEPAGVAPVEVVTSDQESETERPRDLPDETDPDVTADAVSDLNGDLIPDLEPDTDPDRVAETELTADEAASADESDQANDVEPDEAADPVPDESEPADETEPIDETDPADDAASADETAPGGDDRELADERAATTGSGTAVDAPSDGDERGSAEDETVRGDEPDVVDEAALDPNVGLAVHRSDPPGTAPAGDGTEIDATTGTDPERTDRTESQEPVDEEPPDDSSTNSEPESAAETGPVADDEIATAGPGADEPVSGGETAATAGSDDEAEPAGTTASADDDESVDEPTPSERTGAGRRADTDGGAVTVSHPGANGSPDDATPTDATAGASDDGPARSGDGRITDVTIREATLDDAEQLAAIYRSAYAESRGLGFPAKADSVTPAMVAAWIDASGVIVATVGDTIVGGARLEVTDPDRVKVSRLGVRETVKGQGIGSRLLDAAEAAVDAGSAETIWLTTPEDDPYLPDLYRERGYERTGEYPLENRDYDEIVMEKQLD